MYHLLQADAAGYQAVLQGNLPPRALSGLWNGVVGEAYMIPQPRDTQGRFGAVPLKERFEDKIRKQESDGGCWLWKGSRTSFNSGYGQIRIDGRLVKAHRVSYELYHGPLDPNLILLHLCDTKGCVNPGHLRQGTQSENRKEFYAKQKNAQPV